MYRRYCDTCHTKVEFKLHHTLLADQLNVHSQLVCNCPHFEREGYKAFNKSLELISDRLNKPRS
jgi:hypothetical protein